MAVTKASLNSVIRKLNKEASQIEGATLDGLLDAGLFIKNQALKQTPIDTGNLRASAFVTKKTKSVLVGFTAAYAVFVHEINKNYRVGGWKFLQTAIQTNTRKILEIIRKRAKI